MIVACAPWWQSSAAHARDGGAGGRCRLRGVLGGWTGFGELFAGGVEGVHGVALEECDLDWFVVLAMEDAGAFAEYVDGADAGATGAKNIGIENAEGQSRADCRRRCV